MASATEVETPISVEDAPYPIAIDAYDEMVRTNPEAGGEYRSVESIGPGQTVRLALDGIELEPIPFEELLG